MAKKFTVLYRKVITEVYTKKFEAETEKEARNLARQEIYKAQESLKDQSWEKNSNKDNFPPICVNVEFDKPTPTDYHTRHCCYICSCCKSGEEGIACTVTDGTYKQEYPNTEDGCVHN